MISGRVYPKISVLCYDNRIGTFKSIKLEVNSYILFIILSIFYTLFLNIVCISHIKNKESFNFIIINIYIYYYNLK